RGKPLSLTQWAAPIILTERLKANVGIFGQDQWTLRKLTLNLGLRFDYFNAFIPPQSLPEGPFVPARNFAEVDCTPCWKDLELRPGVAVSAGYFRTWFGSFTATANAAVTPADFKSYCITAPTDPRLPGGGGNQICGLYDVDPARFGQVQGQVSQASKFGEWTEVYHGIDLTVNARIKSGVFLTGGMSTGRTEVNNCAVMLGNPQTLFVSPTSVVSTQIIFGPGTITAPRGTTAFCNTVNPWAAQTQVKFSGNYVLPLWGLQTSATYQSLPGIPRYGTYVATNAQI